MKNFFQKTKFEPDITHGVCPTCDMPTMLVSLTKDHYRCITFGSDLEQKIICVIKGANLLSNIITDNNFAIEFGAISRLMSSSLIFICALISLANICISPIIPANAAPVFLLIEKTLLVFLLAMNLPCATLLSDANRTPSLNFIPTAVAPGI